MLIKGCDRCKRPGSLAGVEVRTTFIVTGRGLDAAGSSDDHGESVDICADCMIKLLDDLLSKRDYEMNKRVLAWIHKRK